MNHTAAPQDLGPSEAAPAFGQADLSNCEREQIHLAGSIQPHGALLVLREPDLTVLQASANAAAFLGLAPGDLVGRPLSDLPGDIEARIAPLLSDGLETMPVAVRCFAGAGPAPHDVLMHRPACGAGLVIEIERAGPIEDLSRFAERGLQAIMGAHAMRGLCDEAARLYRELTGYDRVMVYRFDDDGHGEVVSEERAAALEPLLGNRYPASDIPQIARRLYERNRIRVLVDVGYAPVPVLPRLSPETGRELDMSLCGLRSVSPMHIQYLQNMGVGATLVVSIMVGGRLWGLISCHHYAPRLACFRMRAACELLAEALGTRIAALESFAQAQAELSVRRLEQRLIEAISREGDWRAALFDHPQALLQPVGATGAALLFEGQMQTAGEVPSTQSLRAIGEWLDARGPAMGEVVATTMLGQAAPHFAGLTPVASGLLAVPVSASGGGEYLVWFRPEQVRTLTWGGDPTKPMLVGDDPSQLSPRRSFAKWHQVVEGKSEPWSPRDLTAARLIGDTVADVVLQFRSVRLLIARDQLRQVQRQVGASEQPVVIADECGLITLTNEAFAGLIPPGTCPAWPPRTLDDLLPAFAEREEVARRLNDVVAERRAWRGELTVRAVPGTEERPLLVRADPVFSAPDRVLGFVFLFTDLTERKLAEAARRRFQDGIVERHRVKSGRLDSRADLVFRNLLRSVVENAQLAALEITDGVEVARMPRMLDSIRASVRRTAEVLEHLIRHSTARRPSAAPREDGAGPPRPPG